MGANILLQFVNCRLLRNHQLIVEDLWVRNGKIVNPEKVFFDEKIKADRQIDCNGLIIAPGFIEVQINGAFGVDFSFNANVEDGINLVAKGLLGHGVTSFCPTIVTSPKDVYHNILPRISKRAGDANGATILGIHVEGPFIRVEKKGAHPADCIKTLDNGFKTLQEMYGTLENISIVTLAPELSNGGDVIKELTKRNIVVSVGHSIANLCDGEEAVKNGASLITHLFNAMLPFHHRDPGLVGLLTSNQIPAGRTVYFGIISDGVHTHPAALRIAQRAHPHGLVLVTDAISAMGLAEGRHRIGQMEMEVREGKAYIAGTDTLCGSIATMIDCVRHFHHETNCSIEYALECASLHPAMALGISSKKGTLNFDADADFVMLSNDLEVKSTWIAGDCVYRKNPIKSRLI